MLSRCKKKKQTIGRLTAAARRAQLIEVGREVFAERGYGATSIEEIAARAKVSKPILYDHFGGKEGLYAVVVDREMEFILGRIDRSRSIRVTARTPGRAPRSPISPMCRNALWVSRFCCAMPPSNNAVVRCQP